MWTAESTGAWWSPVMTAAAMLVPMCLAGQQAASGGMGGVETRPIELGEALEIARDHNTGLRVAGARTDAARAGARIATSALAPQLRVQSGWSRTVDPVATFGTKLRQGVFGQDDFALEALNDPDPLTDFSTEAVARWGIASPERWARRSAAGSRAEAAEWQLLRTREGTDLRTRTLYYRAVQAGERVEAAKAAEEAAAATRDRFRRRFEEGMLTEADLLQAEAELEAARADRVSAERGRYEARLALGLHLGWDPDRVPAPTDSLPPPESPEEVDFEASARADMRARAAAVEAAESARRGAQLSWAPSLDAFASYSIHGRDLFSDSGNDWSVGVALRWDVFTGLRRPAEAERAGAELRAAELEYRQGLREARGEVRRARRAVAAAREAVEASRAAREAARKGRGLLRRRFEEGLATAADLLQAEARTTAMTVRAVDALAHYHVAMARLRFARSEATGGERP